QELRTKGSMKLPLDSGKDVRIIHASGADPGKGQLQGFVAIQYSGGETEFAVARSASVSFVRDDDRSTVLLTPEDVSVGRRTGFGLGYVERQTIGYPLPSSMKDEPAF